MKIKYKPNDFKVEELLDRDYLQKSGAFRVYLVTKRKVTSLDAADVLASMANVAVSEVSMAGLKDRQGVTSQYMSVAGGKRIELDRPELKIVPVGDAREPLDARHSRGNAFEVRLRELSRGEATLLEDNRRIVEKLGVPNYFDEQRFGNLRHGQGWVAKELMLENHEVALAKLLSAESPHDAGRIAAFKKGLRGAWGDWSECRDIAGRFGQHHSVFEHLRRSPRDFAGAFYHIGSRLRLIHLYAWQSHLWNRAVAFCVADFIGEGNGRLAESIEGPLLFQNERLALDPEWDGSFRLPGEGLEDVAIPRQREFLTDVLAAEGLAPAKLRIDGVSGFRLKGEDRKLFVKPRRLKVHFLGRPGGPRDTAGLSFELPRGAYATLIVRGLLAPTVHGPIDVSRSRDRNPRGDDGRGRRWQGQNAAPPEPGRGRRGPGRPRSGGGPPAR
jgi:tRNA pseudouridine13 synthase